MATEPEMISQLEQALSPSLFASRKLIIARDFLPAKAAEEKLGEFLLAKINSMPADYFLVLWQTGKPDRRLGVVKKILSGDVAVTEFSLPAGRTLNAWLKAYAKTLALEIDDAAAEELAVYLGRDLYEEKKVGGRVVDRKEAYDLWQANSELRKLASYSSTIDISAVRALVQPKIPDNVFVLTDELAKKNTQASLRVLEQLLGQPGADEKTATIKIVGLLAEQFRAMLTVKLLQAEGKNQQEIADLLGWSSGRVFITAKNAASQSTDKLKEVISRLLEIDHKLKSSDESAKLLINRFILAACR